MALMLLVLSPLHRHCCPALVFSAFQAPGVDLRAGGRLPPGEEKFRVPGLRCQVRRVGNSWTAAQHCRGRSAKIQGMEIRSSNMPLPHLMAHGPRNTLSLLNWTTEDWITHQRLFYFTRPRSASFCLGKHLCWIFAAAVAKPQGDLSDAGLVTLISDRLLF
jgi:hypothetical protein